MSTKQTSRILHLTRKVALKCQFGIIGGLRCTDCWLIAPSCLYIFGVVYVLYEFYCTTKLLLQLINCRSIQPYDVNFRKYHKTRQSALQTQVCGGWYPCSDQTKSTSLPPRERKPIQSQQLALYSRVIALQPAARGRTVCYWTTFKLHHSTKLTNMCRYLQQVIPLDSTQSFLSDTRHRWIT